MTLLTAILVVLSALVLGAHFLRSGAWALVALSLGLPVLLFVRRAWARPLLTVGLVLAGFEWVRTGVALAEDRRASGEPWLRMAFILGGVAAVAFLAAVLAFRGTRVRRGGTA